MPCVLFKKIKANIYNRDRDRDDNPSYVLSNSVKNLQIFGCTALRYI